MLNAASLLRVVAVWLLNEKQRHGNVRFGLPCNWKHVSDETGVTPREQERRWKIWIRLPSFSSPSLNLTCFYIFRWPKRAISSNLFIFFFSTKILNSDYFRSVVKNNKYGRKVS